MKIFMCYWGGNDETPFDGPSFERGPNCGIMGHSGWRYHQLINELYKKMSLEPTEYKLEVIYRYPHSFDKGIGVYFPFRIENDGCMDIMFAAAEMFRHISSLQLYVVKKPIENQGFQTFDPFWAGTSTQTFVSTQTSNFKNQGYQQFNDHFEDEGGDGEGDEQGLDAEELDEEQGTDDVSDSYEEGSSEVNLREGDDGPVDDDAETQLVHYQEPDSLRYEIRDYPLDVGRQEEGYMAKSSNAWRPWTNLHTDILMLIMMKLGLIDFLAFSGVCKQWRSSALSNRSTFFAQKEPLILTVSNNVRSKNVCIFRDMFDEKIRYKTALGDDPSREFFLAGVSCGYLIIRRKRSSELYLVNPITRHELYFPRLPIMKCFYYGYFHPILIYSPALSKFIVVILFSKGNDNLVTFSASGDSVWSFLPNQGLGWVDLAFFKGKIYMLNRDGGIGEMKLNPFPGLQLLEVKKMPSLWRVLISSGERLFMVNHRSRIIVKHELDFEKMEWVVRENLGGDCLFVNRVKSSAVVSCTNWLGRGKIQCNSTYRLPKIGGVVATSWYFLHDCCSENHLEDS